MDPRNRHQNGRGRSAAASPASSSAAIVIGVDRLPANDMAMGFLLNPRLSWPIGFATVGILMTIGLAAGLFPAAKPP